MGEAERPSEGLELIKVFKILRRYKWLILLFLILGGIGGYLNSKTKVPLYRASNSIVVEPETSNRAEYLNSQLRLYVPQSFYETQQEIIKSRIVLSRAAESLSPDIIQRMFAPPKDNWLSAYKRRIKDRLATWASLLGISRYVNIQRVEELPVVVDPESLNRETVMAAIARSLSVGFGRTSQILRLNVTSADPLVAAVVVNAVADNYVSYLVENRVSQTEKAGQWLAERVLESRDKLNESENALKSFQFEQQLPDLQTVKNLSSSTLDQANSAIIEAEQKVIELSKRYGPKHPALVEAKRNLSSARAQFGQKSKTDLNTNDNRFELTKLERAVNANRELYELFLSRFNEVELGIDSVFSNTKVLERSRVPGGPFSPNVRRLVSTGASIGFVLALILIFAREYSDRTFKNQDDVEERLQLPVLGVVPLLSEGKIRKKLNRVVPERHYESNSKSNFAEVVNHIRTGIIYSNIDKPPKVILVTSGLPKEGKTTCATNLALAFSKLGKTLLIDADFRKPRIAKISNIEGSEGLTGYVSGHNSLQECISQDSDSSSLYIMRSGEIPPNPLELLSSNRFKETLQLMRQNFDYIIVDSAPIIPVSDGLVIGRHADAILMVVKAGTTTHQVADSAVRKFTSTGLKPIGVILSQLDYKSAQYYYSNYDYYAKEYYGAS